MAAPARNHRGPPREARVGSAEGEFASIFVKKLRKRQMRNFFLCPMVSQSSLASAPFTDATPWLSQSPIDDTGFFVENINNHKGVCKCIHASFHENKSSIAEKVSKPYYGYRRSINI
ncbi:hypothetical protein RND71_009587 [Anisodus tanguticus]|uniref:Uncharacterized protein n=1 Tax=Anisodus tanguticus TaxID=243964 RepID=A0AAE1SIL0_9SOLA|nr:hypothetical protein RND71_009587 [Anisodus tanguticus]